MKNRDTTKGVIKTLLRLEIGVMVISFIIKIFFWVLIALNKNT